MKIDIDSYLTKYESLNKDYNKNDLQSNQEHLAKALQYIYICDPKSMYDKSKLYEKYEELLSYAKAIIVKEIPEYRKKEIGEDFLSKFTLIYSNIKFNPKAFGEIEYVDKILDMPENEKLKLKAVQIAKFWEDYEQKDKIIEDLQRQLNSKNIKSKKEQK